MTTEQLVMQGLLAAFSIASIGLLSVGGRWTRWGFLVGLAGQPLWLWATFDAQQWGMLVVSVFFTAAYANGVWRTRHDG